MLTTGLTAIDSIYKKESTISSKHKILAEWNHNSYYKINYVGSYPIYIDAKSSGSQDPTYSKTFSATDAGGWDNGGFYNTISVDNTQVSRENKEVKTLCSLYNVVEADRPDPGIIYGIGSQTSSTIIQDSKTVKSYNILQSPVRIYPLSNSQGFKYWNSFRYCKPNSAVANENTPAITHELIGKSGLDFKMKGNNAFISYDVVEKGALRTNKITIKTQTVNGYAKNFTVQVLKAGDTNQTWTTIYSEDDDTRLALAKTKTVSGTTGNKNILLTDSSGIYVGMRVVQLGSTANIPTETYVTEVAKDGIVFLDKSLTGDLTLASIKFIDTPSLSDGIVRITGKKINNVMSWSLAGAVEDENALTSFKIPNDGETALDVELITAIRFSAQTMSKAGATLDIIEISPRLVVDFTGYTETLSVDTTIGDASLGLPVGSLVSSTGTIELFNEDNLISNKNIGSILDNILKPNVKFTILNVLTSGATTKYVPVKVLYAESWNEESNWKVSVSLEDSMRFLKDKSASDMLLASRDGIRVSAIIKILLDNAGVSRFGFNKSGDGEEYDYEGYMVRTQLRRIASQAQELLMLTKDEEQFPAWMQSKMTLASEYIDGFYDFYKYSDYSIMTTSDDSEVENDEESDDMEDMLEAEDADTEESDTQVTIGEYTTRHFDMCPSATALYKDILNKTDMIHLVVESLMLHDLLFKIERQAISMDAADEDMIMKAQHYADMIMSIATEMNLVEEHSYVQSHVDTIAKLNNSTPTAEDSAESEGVDMPEPMIYQMPEADSEYDMMPPSARMMKEQQHAIKKR
jgi:hypothetical protein